MTRAKKFDIHQLSEGNSNKLFSEDISGMDIFGEEEELKGSAQKKAKEVSIEKLHPSPKNPYKVIKDSKEMKELIASIKAEGVLNPLLVRPIEGGEYEIVSGHRRRCAAEMAGIKTLPCFIRDLNDEEADKIMVDLNLNRENILPSEKARAVSLKYNAIRRTAGRKAGGNGEAHVSSKIIAKEMGISDRKISEYLRLMYVAKPLMDAVDESTLSQKAAIQLSYLRDEIQEKVFVISKTYGKALTEAAARNIRDALENAENVSEDEIKSLLGATDKLEKKTRKYAPVFRMADKTKKKYFSHEMTNEEMDAVIEKMLRVWNEYFRGMTDEEIDAVVKKVQQE